MTAEENDVSENHKKKAGLMGFMILLVITILIISVTVYLYQQESEIESPVLFLTLKLSDGGDDPDSDRWNPETQTYRPYIQNISADAVFEQGTISSVEVIGDTPLQKPGVIVRAYDYENMIPVSYWTSVLYEGPGDYEFTIKFIETPQNGDTIKVLIDIEDENGTELFPYFAWDTANDSIIYVWQ
ncbi:MAG: hypothetical protein KAI64_03355 [Thermoplasmata archaeon]|nr:hypothetical protein [Thermoplasmata archaeon]